ncbi:molybdate ABC transporter substrate-binding protein [Iamia sp. SCSIO 61187]|uniref:molybdate ABC transporter substrate-binding protein n=1 Tax=Iamia sp. SCSIO 61187 TaxID=2722752 RepID=UPI001C6394D0|nr:molybdate ABC transporter substrate-binding protein [Iamia sp. SCSIO 61187]QYG92462.1 molybdate ABC transporter substrate-binding protein [Iamia sp. SCSIO 61187]
MTGRRAAAGLAALALLGAVLAGCGDDDAPASGDVGGTVTVFAAASLTDVFTDLGAAFEDAHPGTTVELSFGPSSGLVTQIAEGAPADVVATAATETMADLVAADAVAGEPRPFATNALELAVPAGNPGAVDGLDDLAAEDLVVGLCAEEVPCGSLAREALAAAGVEPSVDTDEPDVRALLTKVAAGEVDVGLVYRTDVVAAGAAVEGIEVATGDDLVATYPIATVADAGDPDGARAFIEFVLSAAGQAALADAGFGPPPPS